MQLFVRSAADTIAMTEKTACGGLVRYNVLEEPRGCVLPPLLRRIKTDCPRKSRREW